jgi:hypothetical protein
MQGLVNVVRELKGIISEPVRALVAKKLADMVSNQIKPEDYSTWAQDGYKFFLAACDITCEPAVARDDLDMEPTELALLVNKWAAVTSYKDGEEFKDFTQEMDGVRNAILEDLRFGCQLEDIDVQ